MMHGAKVGLVGRTFALANSNDFGGKRSRIRRSKEERKAMTESFIKMYQNSNDGKFPSITLTHKEVGGSFYIVREIVREIIQENRVLGPPKVNIDEANTDGYFEQYPLGSISVEPQDYLSSSSNGSSFLSHDKHSTADVLNEASNEQLTDHQQQGLGTGGSSKWLLANREHEESSEYAFKENPSVVEQLIDQQEQRLIDEKCDDRVLVSRGHMESSEYVVKENAFMYKSSTNDLNGMLMGVENIVEKQRSDDLVIKKFDRNVEKVKGSDVLISGNATEHMDIVKHNVQTPHGDVLNSNVLEEKLLIAKVSEDAVGQLKDITDLTGIDEEDGMEKVKAEITDNHLDSAEVQVDDDSFTLKKAENIIDTPSSDMIITENVKDNLEKADFVRRTSDDVLISKELGDRLEKMESMKHNVQTPCEDVLTNTVIEETFGGLEYVEVEIFPMITKISQGPVGQSINTADSNGTVEDGMEKVKDHVESNLLESTEVQVDDELNVNLVEDENNVITQCSDILIIENVKEDLERVDIAKRMGEEVSVIQELGDKLEGRSSSNIGKSTITESKYVQNLRYDEDGRSSTLNRTKLKSWEGSSRKASEDNVPVWSAFKAFITVFIKFWTE